MPRTSEVLIFLAFCVVSVCEMAAQKPEAIATLPLSQMLAGDAQSNIYGAVTFISESSIALGVCATGKSTGCSLSVIHWAEGQLKTVATTPDFDSMFTNVHRAPVDALLATTVPGKTVWYSSDLSSTHAAHNVSEISFSGKTSAQWSKDGWTLFTSDRPEPIRNGTGTMLSVSDEFVAFQKNDALHIERIDGNQISLLKLLPKSKCLTEAQILPTARIYLEDCKAIRIVDFSSKLLVSQERPKGWSPTAFERDRWSADGNRVLFNCWSRKVSLLRNAGELAIAFTTLGMGVGDQQDNREEIRVIDATSGRVCFDLHRSFLIGTEPAFFHNAAISPSGQFIAVAADGLLSLYRTSTACRGN